ncbi:MAG: [Fe-Fe] hydrogenase large subunit C-terminal domain-containing protein, partial [Bacteroidales bacterium]|nr:[Fe-Fe] hydrogenase large subunit C-terminal domain-containing protein [Bacteroidales bacterium]
AELIADRCINCGSCYTHCPQEAITYRNSIEKVISWINDEEKLAAILDPAISGEFIDVNDYKKFISMIRQSGFDYVIDGAFAADLLAIQYKKFLDENKGKYYLFTLCPIIQNYVQKYAIKALNNLLPLPILPEMSSFITKKIINEQIKTVYIGPCIAYKDISEFSNSDEVLTFEELRKLFDRFGITEIEQEFSSFDFVEGKWGNYFAIEDGILIATDQAQDILSTNVISSSGENLFKDAIFDFMNYIEIIKKHFNIYYCNGCIMGPAITLTGNYIMKKYQVLQYSQKRLRDLDEEKWKLNINKYINETLPVSFKNLEIKLPKVSKKQIEDILNYLQITPSAKPCKNCGFDTCEEFATAIAQGIANSEMCIYYNIANKIKLIKKLNNQLEKLNQKIVAEEEKGEKLKEELQLHALIIENIKELLHKVPAGILVVNGENKVEYSNEFFVKLLGDEVKEINEIVPGLRGSQIEKLLDISLVNMIEYALTHPQGETQRDILINNKWFNVSVYPIKYRSLAVMLIKDISIPEVNKAEVVEEIKKAIEKELAMVQQIAFSLGEGASEVERILNKVIKIYEK